MIDIGANLTHRSFDADLVQVLERAREQSVSKIIITGSDPDDTLKARDLAMSCDGLFFTAGIHPHNADKCIDRVGDLVAFGSEPKMKAWGEIGLDYYRDFASKKGQLEVFDACLEISFSDKKPLFLHEREAFADFYDLLASKKNNLTKFVVHCFTGNKDALSKYLDLGAYIGLTGWICQKRGRDVAALVPYIPTDRLMIETDAPYLSASYASRNEPKDLYLVLERVAKELGRDISEVEMEIFQTTSDFFGI